MPLYEPTIPLRYVAPLLDLVRELDPDCVAPVLSAGALTQREFDDGNASVSLRQFEAMLLGASEQLKRDDVGFLLGPRITIDLHSTLGQVLRGCTTLEALLRVTECYYRLVTPAFSVRFKRDAGHGEWLIRVAAPMSSAVLHMFLEMQAMSVYTDIARLLDTESLVDIYITCPPPPHAARYHQLRRARFHFSAISLPEVRMVFPAAMLTQPLRHAHGDGHETVSLDATQLPRRLSRRYGAWAETMLREAVGVQPSLQVLAELLSMSARNLTRKLAAENVNLRELGKRVRHERACALLADPQLSLISIAYQLGYSDVSAFGHAFRERSGGDTPGAWRREHAGIARTD